LRTFGPTALIPEEGPDEAEGGDDLVGVDFFVRMVGGSFFLGGLSLTVLPFTTRRACGDCGLLRTGIAYFRLYSVINSTSFRMVAFSFRIAFR
jgi:hypothetical protein